MPTTTVPTTAAASATSSTTSSMTPAAIARAKKLASGGMDFVERPGSVYVSPRNLAPPPTKPPPLIPIEATLPAGAAAKGGDVVAVLPITSVAPVSSSPSGSSSFSFIRWYCTSDTPWCWCVRGLSLTLTALAIYLIWQYYRAWRQRMTHWKEKHHQRQLAANSPTNTSTTCATASTGPPPASSTTTFDGSTNYRLLSELIQTRYSLLQRYAAVLKHIRTCGPADPLNDTNDDVGRLTSVFDELDSVLAENSYLRDLLQRINASLKKT